MMNCLWKSLKGYRKILVVVLSVALALEFPYLQRIYEFYGAKDQVRNIHLPKERHDFGKNKRNAVYDFFIDVFGLDRSMLDESKIEIEPEDQLKSLYK